MRMIQFDSTGGASGDMILGALFGLGVDPDEIARSLASLPMGEFRLRAEPHAEHGLHGLRVTVEVRGEQHAHRRLADIRALLGASGLPESVRALSLRVFGRLAEAEAAVHRMSPEDVHFHEVGAVDSIVDIVGSCAALHRLAVDGVAVGALPAGYGTVESQHGTIPVPAPATVELLRGHPIVQTPEPYELVTPTGAALLMTWKTADAPPDGWAGVRQAFSFGHRALKTRPNLLRACLLEGPREALSADACVVLECNVDDTVPELLGSLCQQLLDRGALDVFAVSAQMKKQRPGTLLTVLCRPEDKAAVLDLIFAESTTFGVRERTAVRHVLDRRVAEVQTPYGPVRIKIGSRAGRELTRKPEYEDCVRCARAAGVAVRAVHEAACLAAAGLPPAPPPA